MTSIKLLEKNIVSVLIFSIFLFSQYIEHWLSGIFLLLLLIAIIRVWFLDNAWLKDDKSTQMILIIGALMFFFTLWSNTLAGWMYASIVRLEVDLKQFLALFLLIYLYHFKNCYHWFFRALPIAAIVMFIQVALGGFEFRPNTFAYAYIIFGNWAALLFYLILLSKDYMKLSSKKAAAILQIIGLISAFVAMLFAGSRGGWLTFIVLTLFYLFFYQFRKMLLLKFSLLIILLLGFGFIMSKQEYLVKGVYKGTLNYFNKTKNQLDINDQTSVGIRLRQIDAGIKAWLNKPLLGYGAGGSSIGVNEEVLKGSVSKYLWHPRAGSTNSHLHNNYITTLVDKGIIGFFLQLYFFLFIFYTFYRYRDKSLNLSFMGMIFVLAHLSFSLTEVPFIRNNHTAIFYFGFIVLWHSMKEANE